MVMHATLPSREALTALDTQLTSQTPQAIVRWAIDHYFPNLALTCSFGGSSGMVLLDMALKIEPNLPVLVLDTGLLFSETYALVEQIEKHYGITVQYSRPTQTVAEQAATHGPELWGTNPDLCCKLRKVEPLKNVLAPYDAWLTALRRDQSSTRANTPVVSWNDKHQLVKICPLALWTERDIWRYIHANGVPYNPLLDQGYTSLGCHTCTSHPVNGDPRSGRWAGFNKTECGLHI
ncbi:MULTISPECIES: phosphoadenylyl-sulfate reductase [Herpetosiphon]|uniref:phosphoadenylyl-sulfate reductase n=1 Tax=Herpetosiphon TaxID=64 RepID=UPI0009FAA20D|nr:phosphoadenylyl-sulfate reductase [Herpetosiphon geysericola]